MAQPRTAEEEEAAPERCSICLSPFEEQSVGSLENCTHVFCIECILQWSKTSNTCPVDRTTFASIHQRRQIGGIIQKKLKVTPPRAVEEEEGTIIVICENCGRSDRRTRMLVCSLCDSGFHMNCVTPAVSGEPDGRWACPECELGLNQPDSFSAEGEISDGEIEDILSEVGETTSSRLRPSTVNHPGGSRGSRPGERIQTRSNRGPTAPPSITRVPKYLLKTSTATADNNPRENASASEALLPAETEQRNRKST